MMLVKLNKVRWLEKKNDLKNRLLKFSWKLQFKTLKAYT